MNQQQTWNALQDFKFPTGFNLRLQQQTSWDRNFCIGAIEEYLKFAHVFKFSGHPVTPSKVVDEVWHCHLHYTQNYWFDFCVSILEKSLHHHPGNGENDSAFEEQYGMTYESYRSAFGEPPSKFWPKPKSERNSHNTEQQSNLYSDPSTLNYFDIDSGWSTTPTPIIDSSFGGGQFGGSGAGADFGGSDSSTGSDGGYSCGGGCGGD